MIDIIVIGAGTAGLTAAIYARRAGRSVTVFEAVTYGGQIVNTPEIENYPGIANISGFEFATALYNQATGLGAEVKMERVIGIDDGETKTVRTDKGEYQCKAVILATGAKNRPLGLENEKELIGKGVSYCATCDGMFFRKKTVAVAGGGNTAIEDAFFLSNYCEKVYVIHRRDAFRADEREVSKLKAKDNVEFVLNANVTALKTGDNGRLCGVEVTDKFSGEKRVIDTAGLFVAIGQAPDNSAFVNVAKLDKGGYIEAGEDCKLATGGIFTAGDCRTKTVRQLTTAASDGAVAALAACGYIDSL